MSKNDAIIDSLKINFTPIFLTSFTTGVGIAGLNFGDIPAYSEMANTVVIGSTFSFILSVTILPIIFMLMPIKTDGKSSVVLNALSKLGDLIYRFKLYINGVLETSFSTATYPNQNEDTAINQAEICRLGCNVVATNSFFEGLLSHVHFTDGYAYDASTFGSTDATTGEWKINTNPSITMGTNGFTILKDGNTITDQSSNSNDFTLGAGTLTPTVDNPSNCFATLNPLTRINASSSKSFNNANTTFEVTNNNWGEAMSTLAVSSGKYYVEFNIEKLESSNGYAQVGVMDYPLWGSTNNTYQYFLSNAASAGLGLDHRTGQSGVRSAASVVSSNVGDFSNGDKIGLAVDMDNKAMYVHLNGTYYQVGGVTGVPTSGASKTGALTIPAACTLVGIGCACYSTDARIAANYGNGYFRTTAVSSAQNPDDGKGIFEYDVPAGYTALSTGGLNQ